ncbi:hypothetical protein [Riemerella columbipharyngis]|uniref:Uncharacterized protein n=1 Tax=Riemerella columbipharyngis TaxID=1071918 RepID=A0A1G7DZD3_9FLAO|nr:hypothetical protein [Riemerella columbipharyngis]SDE56843.1 hypothetical protein SAMN05421544_11347 [Riemerella columbipharyngis]
MQLDPVSNMVTSIKGRKVLFLINGVEISDNQIKSVTPTNVARNDASVNNSNQSYTNPSLDLYYSQKLGKKDELSFNLIGSRYTTNSSQFKHE